MPSHNLPLLAAAMTQQVPSGAPTKYEFVDSAASYSFVSPFDKSQQLRFRIPKERKRAIAFLSSTHSLAFSLASSIICCLDAKRQLGMFRRLEVEFQEKSRGYISREKTVPFCRLVLTLTAVMMNDG